jgi:hypothetical protein
MKGWEFTETKSAWKKLKRNFRILACEWLMSKGMDIAPADYDPVLIELLADAEKRATRPSSENFA